MNINFQKLLGDPNLDEVVKEKISNFDFSYTDLDEIEVQQIILKVLKRIFEEPIIQSGPSYLDRWELGWGENLKAYKNSSDLHDLLPKFIKAKQPIRFQGKYVLPSSDQFETNMVEVLRTYIFTKYLSQCESVHEFGCGTGLNLVSCSKIYPKKRMVGLDWSKASCDIVKQISQQQGINLAAHRFDMFKPDYNFNVPLGAGMFTIGAMEQLGDQYREFVDFILEKKYSICVHMETIHELYDSTLLIDWLAKTYIEKRNWLRGFYTYLSKLEKDGIIRILYARRTFGSIYHDGYTMLAWKPL